MGCYFNLFKRQGIYYNYIGVSKLSPIYKKCYIKKENKMDYYIKLILVKLTVNFLNQSEAKQIYEESISIMQAKERAAQEEIK